MERTSAEAKGYEIVNVMPQPHAGGNFAVTAWNAFTDPVAVEAIQADAGMDIGSSRAIYQDIYVASIIHNEGRIRAHALILSRSFILNLSVTNPV